MTDSTNWGYFTNGTIHLICSSHNDIAWFDTPAATITWRDEKSITPALVRMAQHQDVRFSMENVLYLLEYLERHPERKAKSISLRSTSASIGARPTTSPTNRCYPASS